jgi:ubiquinone/menaquinone biosynthesis C-methylase UbiE
VSEVKLLPEKELIRTSRVDHADWNYRPFLSFVMRRRFALISSLLPRVRVQRLLEVGFGSGIFLPELARKCTDLYGIDVHDEVDQVESRLEHYGLAAKLSRQDAATMDFPNEFFDVIVSVSALEFIDDIKSAARQLARVLVPHGRLIAVMPNKFALLDFALHAATGEDAERDYGGRRERVLPSLLEYFRVIRRKTFFPIYAAYEFEKQ